MVNGHQTYVYVGLGGEGENIAEGGMYRKADGGEWESIATGLPDSPQVRALAIHPNNPSTVFAGTQAGLYRTDDRGDHWEALDSPKDMDCWSLAFRPGDANTMFAGYEPCSVYRSVDGGASWKQTNTDAIHYPNVTNYMPPLAKRVIGISVDPPVYFKTIVL